MATITSTTSKKADAIRTQYKDISSKDVREVTVDDMRILTYMQEDYKRRTGNDLYWHMPNNRVYYRRTVEDSVIRGENGEAMGKGELENQTIYPIAYVKGNEYAYLLFIHYVNAPMNIQVENAGISDYIPTSELSLIAADMIGRPVFGGVVSSQPSPF